jgi:predicted metal-binding protein
LIAADRTPRVRHVECVGGCPTPGNVALDSLGKARVRFSAIEKTDAADLLTARPPTTPQ